MKRLFLFTLVALLAVGLQAQTYHPFVERAKRWCVHGFSMGSDHTVTDYYFSPEKNQLERNGHSYEQLCARTQDGNDKPLGWFREENQRVYMYKEEEDKEVLTYDFSLKVGDRFEPEYGDFEHCEVTKIDYLMVYGDSLKVINFEANDKTSDTAVRVNGRWIEGIGSEMNPLDGLFSHSAPNSWSYYLAYVSGSSYWPFTFSQPYNGWWGQSLETIIPKDVYEQYEWNQQQENLNYEMVYNVESNTYNLHVFGFMDMNCGPYHYIYCIDEQTAESNIHRLTLQHEDVPPLADCKGGHKVDFVISGFNKDCTYTVVDERGEHPVAVRDVSYRPFIEEGKVWKVGWFPGGMNTAQKLDYYYFEGDSIIDGRQCKKMMCRHEANERWGNPEPWTEYVGAICEKERRVYCVFPDKHDFMLLYDFATPIGEKIDIYDPSTDDKSNSCIIERRFFDTNEYYKGYSTAVALYQELWEDEDHNVPMDYDREHLCYWKEGIGSSVPLDNVFHYGWAGNYYHGMSCTIGDEVLYYIPYLKDGVTPPDGADVKKHWIDFTHIKKPRPKAPARERTANETDEENLTGEYSDHELFVNLKILSGAYTVTLKDAADNVVYRRDVQTSSTIALNTDLTKYPAGTYMLVVENSEEQYTATLTLPLDDTAVRDLPSIVNCKMSNCKWYDLSGRQIRPSSFDLRHLPKGVYIRDGRKVVVR